MKGYDVTPSSNFKAFPRAGSRKHMKYEYEGTWKKTCHMDLGSTRISNLEIDTKGASKMGSGTV